MQHNFTNQKRLRGGMGAMTMKNQQRIVTAVFLAVPLILLFMFTYFPFFKMIQFSFYDMKYIGKRTWVGLQNYKDIFSRDDCFDALKLSLYYMVGSVVQLSLALLFAALLTEKTKGSKFFRGALYFPCLIGGIAVGFIFKFFFTHGFILDTLLSFVGFDIDSLPYWLKDTKINNWMLVATSVWRYMGQNMVLFIGAMASVDTTQYEAAEIDGANRWQKFFYITLPSIKTIVILNLILAISGSLSAFEMPYVVTGGGFGTSTYFVLMNTLAHKNQKVGLACAMAVFLLTLILIVTGIQKYVEYRMSDDYSKKHQSKRGAKI